MYSIYLRVSGARKTDLECFRAKYDSLANKIEGHITIVFPRAFSCEEHVLTKAMDTLSEYRSFDISFSEDIIYSGDVGYLTAIMGAGVIREIHKKINAELGIISKQEYVPHLTVVRNNVSVPISKDTPASIDFDVSNYTVTNIVLERIYSNDNSVIKYEIQM